MKIMMLAVAGNYVTTPKDPVLSSTSSMLSVPIVVVDTYTGNMMMHIPYSGVRGYFVEALLLISIVVIARLTFVRNTTFVTFVPIAEHSAVDSSASVPNLPSSNANGSSQPASQP
jgi:hypothetical protein